MKLNISNPFWQVVGLGALAGLRSASSPAIASDVLSRHHSKKLTKSPLRFMGSGNVAIALKVLAAGEFIVDKLPSTPNRIKAFSVIARCAAGSLAGASIYKATGHSAIEGALLGSIAALGSTFGSYYLRKAIVSHSGIADPIIGAIEDVLVTSAGVGLIYTA